MPEIEANKIVQDEACRDILDPQSAEFYDSLPNTFSALDPDGEINRFWPNLEGSDNEVRLFGYQEFLYRWTDATNDTQQQWIDNPVVGKELVQGRWRHAKTQILTSKGGTERRLVQTLRKGFIQTLLNGADVNFQEGRQVQRTSIPLDEEYVIIEWPNVDPSRVEVIVAEIAATSFVAPLVQNKQLSGTWYRINTVHDVNREDGSAVIRMILAKSQYTLNLYRSYGTEDHEDVIKYFQVPKVLVPAILLLHKVEGTSIDASYGNAGGLVDLTVTVAGSESVITFDWFFVEDGCLFTEERKIYFGLTKSAAEAAALSIEGDGGDGYIYSKSGPTATGNGRYALVITRRKAVARTSPSTGSVTVEKTPFATTTRVQYDHQTNPPAASLLTLAAGYLKRLVRWDVDEFCTNNYTLETQEAIEKSAEEVHTESTLFEKAYLTIKRNLSALPVVATWVQGTLHRFLGLNFNEFQRWDLTDQRVESQPYELEFEFKNNTDETETHTYKFNQRFSTPAAIQASFGNPTGDQERTLQTFNINPDKTYTYHMVTRPREEGIGTGQANEITYQSNIGVSQIWQQVPGTQTFALYVSYRSALHTIQQFETEQEAYAFISTTTNALQGTNVTRVGFRNYRAETVVDQGWSTPAAV